MESINKKNLVKEVLKENINRDIDKAFNSISTDVQLDDLITDGWLQQQTNAIHVGSPWDRR